MDYRVTKSNAMNELTVYQQKSPLSLREQKVALAVISLISPNDDEFREYELTLSELSRLTGIGLNHLDKNLVRDICGKLVGTIFVIEGAGSTAIVPFFTKAEYQHDKSVFFRFPPELKPHLLNLRQSFTTYQLQQITQLSSTYSIRFYEIFRQRLSLADAGRGVTNSFLNVELNRLRDWLGVEPKQYPRFNNFKQFILTPAQRELAEKTDLCFEFKTETKRRKVVGIQFLIRVNARAKPAPTETERLPACTNETMLRMIRMSIPNIPERNAILLANSYNQDVLTEALLGLMEAGDGVRNPVAYLNGILKNKRLEPEPSARTHRTTHEKLTDRSWAEGLVIEDWDS